MTRKVESRVYTTDGILLYCHFSSLTLNYSLLVTSYIIMATDRELAASITTALLTT